MVVAGGGRETNQEAVVSNPDGGALNQDSSR